MHGNSVSYDTLHANLILLTYTDSEKAANTRRKKVFVLDEYGPVQFWIPVGIEDYSKNISSLDCKKKLKSVADGWDYLRRRNACFL